MNITKTSTASEGGHWYRRCEDGVEQIDEVCGANGKLRKPNLRDAKKAGDWLVGCTTIVRQAAADGLVRWQINEAVRATVELGGPRVRVEDGEAKVEDWRQFMRVVRQRADEFASDARNLGTAAHAAFHLRISDPIRYARMRIEPGVGFENLTAMGMADAIHTALSDFWEGGIDDYGPDWKSEDPVLHPTGFATKADLWTPLDGGWLFDFKGKQSTEELTNRTYEQHHLQLAATREAIRHTHGVDIPAGNCRIVYFTREHPWAAEVADACGNDIERGWKMFQALFAYWKVKTNHNPGWVE